jgi:hypothetical protein
VAAPSTASERSESPTLDEPEAAAANLTSDSSNADVSAPFAISR